MSKSTPINQLLNNNNNLVDEILNEIEPTMESTNIEETQKKEQKRMEEKMKEQIEEQKRQEEYQQDPEQEEYQQDPEQEEYQQEQEEYQQEQEEYQQDPEQEQEYMANNVEGRQEINVSNPISNKSFLPKEIEDKCKVKGLLEQLIDNIKPTLIVIVLTMCVLSNISTQMIDKILPHKEIIIKYHIMIMIVLKSLLSGIIFFISNLLL